MDKLEADKIVSDFLAKNLEAVDTYKKGNKGLLGFFQANLSRVVRNSGGDWDKARPLICDALTMRLNDE